MCKGFFLQWEQVVYNANSLLAPGHAERRAGPGETSPESRGLPWRKGGAGGGLSAGGCQREMDGEVKDAFNNPAGQWLPGGSCSELFVCGESVVPETWAALPAPPRALAP